MLIEIGENCVELAMLKRVVTFDQVDGQLKMILKGRHQGKKYPRLALFFPLDLLCSFPLAKTNC